MSSREFASIEFTQEEIERQIEAMQHHADNMKIENSRRNNDLKRLLSKHDATAISSVKKEISSYLTTLADINASFDKQFSVLATLDHSLVTSEFEKISETRDSLTNAIKESNSIELKKLRNSFTRERISIILKHCKHVRIEDFPKNTDKACKQLLVEEVLKNIGNVEDSIFETDDFQGTRQDVTKYIILFLETSHRFSDYYGEFQRIIKGSNNETYTGQNACSMITILHALKSSKVSLSILRPFILKRGKTVNAYHYVDFIEDILPEYYAWCENNDTSYHCFISGDLFDIVPMSSYINERFSVQLIVINKVNCNIEFFPLTIKQKNNVRDCIYVVFTGAHYYNLNIV